MARIAIIGTGIAGMGAAWYLHRDHEITVFEAENRIGGHTNTVFVEEPGKDIPIDTGFIVFNNHTYPRLTALFDALQVKVKKTDMSFAAQICDEQLEYCGSSLNKLFAQRRRIFSPRYIRFLKQLDSFNKTCIEVIDNEALSSLSIRDYLRQKSYSDDLLNWYILPMSSALWSTPPDTTAQFPVLSLVRFFSNHGFLGLNTQFQWYTVAGGSEQYKQKLIAPFKERILVNHGVRSIRRTSDGVELTDVHGNINQFDKVIVAAHGDQALRMWSDASQEERALLSPFSYQKNVATLHTDGSIMPKKKMVWSSWNYRTETRENELVSSCTYWMNSLQDVSDYADYFVTINDPGIIDKTGIIKEIEYEHPVFTVEAMQAQAKLPELNRAGNLLFCGSYFRYGFHEDALMSAANVCEQILGRKVI